MYSIKPRSMTSISEKIAWHYLWCKREQMPACATSLKKWFIIASHCISSFSRASHLTRGKKGCQNWGVGFLSSEHVGHKLNWTGLLQTGFLKHGLEWSKRGLWICKKNLPGFAHRFVNKPPVLHWLLHWTELKKGKHRKICQQLIYFFSRKDLKFTIYFIVWSINWITDLCYWLCHIQNAF